MLFINNEKPRPPTRSTIPNPWEMRGLRASRAGVHMKTNIYITASNSPEISPVWWWVKRRR